MTKLYTGLLIAGLCLSGAAQAESHMDEKALNAAVTARQSTMKLYAFNLGILGTMAKGQAEYNAEAATAAASNLVKLSSQDQMAYWPQGSDNASIENTKALPAMWENMDDVGAANAKLEEAAVAMEAAAGTDLASLQGAMGGLGGACGGCHKSYRESDN
tara:strand:+ start:38814 stop:39290 length:477 start_codon:yes stop_codon:yes gene_type:complete